MKKYTQEVTTSPLLAEVQVSYRTKIKSADMPKIKDSWDTYNYLKKIYNPEIIEHREEFIILLLNRAQKVIGWCKISAGGTSGTVCDPKIIFQVALKCNASAIVLSHSHPSGLSTPSESDIKVTKQLKEGGKLLDIAVFDHIIVTTEGYYSFSDEGKMF